MLRARRRKRIITAIVVCSLLSGLVLYGLVATALVKFIRT